MNESIKQIPLRIREMREILDISDVKMAELSKVDIDTYRGFEDGSVDIPISALYDIAAALHVDFSVLLTGESPRVSTASVVRAGKGAKVDRYEGYEYETLTANFIHPTMQPMLVTIKAGEAKAKLVAHSGQEFNYVTHGTVRVIIGSREHILTAGDSIYFDPTIPHSQSAVTETATFLTVIKE